MDINLIFLRAENKYHGCKNLPIEGIYYKLTKFVLDGEVEEFQLFVAYIIMNVVEIEKVKSQILADYMKLNDFVNLEHKLGQLLFQLEKFKILVLQGQMELAISELIPCLIFSLKGAGGNANIITA